MNAMQHHAEDITSFDGVASEVEIDSSQIQTTSHHPHPHSHHLHNDAISSPPNDDGIQDSEIPMPLDMDSPEEENVILDNYEMTENGEYLYVKEEVVQSVNGQEIYEVTQTYQPGETNQNYTENSQEYQLQVDDGGTGGEKTMITYAGNQKSMEDIIDVLNTSAEQLERHAANQDQVIVLQNIIRF